MYFRHDQAEKELALAMHGPHPTGGHWSGFQPIAAHVQEASRMALADDFDDDELSFTGNQWRSHIISGVGLNYEIAPTIRRATARLATDEDSD